jgi:TRAP-type transport system periplasmic protein
MMKRAFSVLAYVVLLAGIVLAGASTSPAVAAAKSDKVIKLKFATHLPPMHHGYRNFTKPWADEVSKRTEGRVQVVVYPDQQLGKVNEIYDRLVDGTCDIAFIIPSFIAGRFPLEDVFHLPTLIPGFMTDPTFAAISKMVYEKYLQPLYFKDVKILWSGRFGLNNLHMAAVPVKQLEDLKGKVIGFPGGRVSPLYLKALGPAVEMVKSGDAYTSLEKKVIDGMIFPMDSLRGWKLKEVVKYTTRLDFASASNITAMNLKSWNKLSPADQKIITEMIPLGIQMQGKTYWEDAELAIEDGKKAGVQFIELSPSERKRWVDAVEPVTLDWVKENDAQGLPASAMYKDIMNLRKK